ncbi:MAG: RNB domain-containing ribonuclease, partial [Gemmatimonadetes bacterium]|nr:RNB domain-containing ribonuclease [Gemmatimonadota bacterium]
MSHDRPDREAQVLGALAGSRRGPLKPKELARELGVPSDAYRGFKQLLDALERAGRIYRVKGNRYGLPGSMSLSVGRASLTRSGDAFVRPEGGGGDVYVPSVDLASAMDGDRVVVRIESRPPGRSPTGRVIKVLERARATVVGTLHRARRFSYVVPLDRRMARDVLVPPGGEGGAADGDVVVLRIVSYGEGSVGPAGEVEHVLGRLSDPGVDILAIAHGYGLALEFPRAVTRAAEEAAGSGMAEQGESRVDRTDLLVVTIDPADAKDHDDALSVEPLGEALWEVGVHIADVAHFAPEGGPVDEEARSRGTSVYLVDRAIPMLPERLSGDVCSLREGVDRLALSVFLTVDAAGSIHAERVQRTRIRCRRLLSYEQVQEALDGARLLGPGLDETLRTLADLARGLRRRREERGALDLALPESRVLLGGDGIPLDIQEEERLESHRLVEGWMIAA